MVGLLLGNILIFASIPAAIYLALIFFQSADLQFTVKVTRSIEKSQINEEESSRVRLRITNTSRIGIPTLNIEDAVPSELVDDSQTLPSFSLSLEAGETKDVFYILKAQKFGVYSLGPVLLEAEDSSGFRQVESQIDTISPVVVLPKATERLIHFKIAPRKTKPWPGEIRARRAGLGMDDFSIRQYIPGDSFRRINWRASARSGMDDQLLLNEQMAELGADTIIVVDARPIANVGSEPESTITHSIRAAISIADKLLRDRNRVGLVTIGLNSERIAPGYGRRQYNKLMLSLIRVRPGEFFTFENISRYLRFFFPNLAQVVLISPLIDEEAFDAAAEISRLGYELLVISPNPLDFTEAKKNNKNFQIAMELAELGRKSNLGELRRAHSIVVDWRKDEPLDFILSKNIRAWIRQAGLMRSS